MSKSGIQTIYIRNLNEKVSIKKLKKSLMELFQSKGFEVAQLDAFRNQRLKGQAFVTLIDSQQVKLAVQVLNMYMFLGQMMDVKLAKVDSDRGKELKGQRINIDALKAERLQRRTERTQNKPQQGNKRKREDTNEGSEKSKKPKNDRMEPNKILLFTDLPDNLTNDELNGIFKDFNGFLNLTYVSVRRLALVEFKTETDSIYCLGSLGKNPIVNGETCQLMFAKK